MPFKSKSKSVPRTPLVLAILDGWGIGPQNKKVNPLLKAKTPYLASVLKQYPQAELCASGVCVGLPKGQDGNSEAGHLNLGAGRVVEQDAVIISRSIKDGTFFKNAALLAAVERTHKYKSNLHLMGLLSNYNSGHSSPDHFQALLKFLHQQGVKRVYIHFFTDGRDSPKYDALKFLQEARKQFYGGEIVVSVVGRFYAMDRKKFWSSTEKTYNLLTQGKGLVATDPEQAIRHAYNRGESDEFISPTVIVDAKNKPIGRINSYDAVIFFNLRSDRARQMAKPFVQKEFEKLNPQAFKRKKILKHLRFVAMTDFGPDLGGIITAYPSVDIKNSLPVVLKNLRQLYISETEKYAHVTYFFNGGYANPVAGENRIAVPSPRVSLYDQVPGMSANKTTALVVKHLKQGNYDFITLNYPNPDMIAHTGNFAACVKAMEIIDAALAKIGQAIKQKQGSFFITADHGNVEELINAKTGEINTDHSAFSVPAVLVHHDLKGKKFSRRKGILADVAPTILDWLKITKPKEMSGMSLFRRKS
ncbi:MAG: 2,3-bisphosphoglycerate-independent phosphoglycerate mutase [Patescibacteria group bacterium]